MKDFGWMMFALLIGVGSLMAAGCTPPETDENTSNASDSSQTESDPKTSSKASNNSSTGQNALADSRNDWKNAKPNLELSGKVTIDGSSTVYPITEAVAASFKQLYGNVSVSVGKSGTGGGFKRFNIGETDISDASRPIKDSEYKACNKNKISFVELPVAYDGLTVVVPISNDFVQQLTIDDLKKIFLADSAAKTWNQVDPSYPETVIKVFAPGTDSGTFDYFKEVVAGKKGAIRSDMSTSENDDVLVNGVAGDVNAIGFFGAAYYFQNQDKLRAVPIVNPDTGNAVLPSDETIENGTYAPFSRPLFIYVNADSINDPQIEKFVDFYLANANRFAKQVGYVALPDAVYERAFDNFLDGNVGTHYLTKDMKKRHGPVTDVYQTENILK